MKPNPPERPLLVDIFLVVCIVVLASLMVGCAATQSISVSRAVAEVCAQKAPERPTMYTDDLKAGTKVDTWVRAARAELLVREGYEERLRVALQACIEPLQSSVK